ncbi:MULTISPECIES: outer membrane protein [unclassified Thioalkalivibrio]|uniref:outer membrane protein n=1 Tax=unclassified Thioalkalivibrio TaxID=2621013 RepID=UPI00035C4BA7|nr:MULTISPECIES: porin family protein [unclassified Thioalkalivibrio]
MHRKTRLFAALTGACAFLTLTGTAQANAFHGPYVGGQLGWVGYDIDYRESGDERISGLSASGFTGGVMTGWGTVMDNGLYLGIELDAQTEDADLTVRLDDAELGVDSKYSYGITGRLGTTVNDTVLLYGLAGYQRSRLDYRLTDTDEDVSIRFKDNLNGARIGLGVEYQLESRLFMRAEYSYTFMENERYRVEGETLRVDPDAQRFMIGLGYRF